MVDRVRVYMYMHKHTLIYLADNVFNGNYSRYDKGNGYEKPGIHKVEHPDLCNIFVCHGRRRVMMSSMTNHIPRYASSF